ncbi:MAG: hypothetical protein M3292_07980, partial [Actinomycetota bacterium]|nr:hypothetical protein [Actinomycetota bacterium]
MRLRQSRSTRTRSESALAALTRAVLAHRRLVALFWAAVALAGLVGAGRASDALDPNFSMPKSEAFATNERVQQLFASGGKWPTLVAVAELPSGLS